jgi:type II secretory pathway pseudopilin PulG
MYVNRQLSGAFRSPQLRLRPERIHATDMTQVSSMRSTRPRGGFSLVEVIVSTVLLGTVTVTLAPLFGWITQQRRAADHRQMAVLEVANLTERIAAQEWHQVTNEGLAELTVSDSVQQALDTPKLETSVSLIPGPPEAKRIMVQLSWRDRGGNRVAPVTVVNWLHNRKGGD